MEPTYTNDQIMANRRRWIDYLKNPDTKKAQGWLDLGNGERCCLGHGCFVLGIVSEKNEKTKPHHIEYDGEDCFPPASFVEMVGLYGNDGEFVEPDDFSAREGFSFGEHTFYGLANLNDDSEITPQEIGEYLESVIEGGENTPFIRLT
jgi:hypothetical protein